MAARRNEKNEPMSIYQKLESLNITLPPLTAPVAAFVPYVRSGNLLYVSGHIAKIDGKPWVGKLGRELTTDQGKNAARSVAIDLLGTLHAAVGDLERVARVVKLTVLVNSDDSFTEQHLVANGASELLVEVFGERGKHARAAFGIAQIPFGSCIEIELVAEITDDKP
jgi:enamine deaminase RidA (YjgF/YER057c/UK114 family)